MRQLQIILKFLRSSSIFKFLRSSSSLKFLRSSSILKFLRSSSSLKFLRSSSILKFSWFFLHVSSSWVELSSQTENQLPGCPGTGLKVCLVVVVVDYRPIILSLQLEWSWVELGCDNIMHLNDNDICLMFWYINFN